ncbi:hypothetical protein AAVH_35814, partial [Aphelenchoides avenae]
ESHSAFAATGRRFSGMISRIRGRRESRADHQPAQPHYPSNRYRSTESHPYEETEQLLNRSSRSPSPSHYRQRHTTPPPPLNFPTMNRRTDHERGGYHDIGTHPGDQYQMTQLRQSRTSSMNRPMRFDATYEDDDYGRINRYYGANNNGRNNHDRLSEEEEPMAHPAFRQRRLPLISTAPNSARYSDGSKASPGQMTNASPRQGYGYPSSRGYSSDGPAPPSPSPRSPAELNMYSDRAAYPERSGYDAPMNSATRDSAHFSTYSLPPVSTVPLSYNRRPLVTGVATKPIPPRVHNSTTRLYMPVDSMGGGPRHVVQAQPGNVPLSDSDTESINSDPRWPMI